MLPKFCQFCLVSDLGIPKISYRQEIVGSCHVKLIDVNPYSVPFRSMYPPIIIDINLVDVTWFPQC